MSATWSDFISGYFLWRDAILAALTVAIVCGWLGVYVVLKRIIFVSAALPQASGLGIAVAFYLGSFFGEHGHDKSIFLDPTFMSLVFSFLTAGVFSFNIHHRLLSNEALIGVVYIVSSALLLQVLNSPRIVQEAHEIGDILFGNAVVIDAMALRILVMTASLVLLIHVVFFKEFVFVSFDPEMAGTLGLKVRRINLVLFFTIAATVSVSTRAIGALPVFAFMILPPLTALMASKTLKLSILISVLIGSVSAVIGYTLSYLFSLPTGSTMVGVMMVFLAFASLRLRSK